VRRDARHFFSSSDGIFSDFNINMNAMVRKCILSKCICEQLSELTKLNSRIHQISMMPLC
jgi:hypothetical protein